MQEELWSGEGESVTDKPIPPDDGGGPDTTGFDPRALLARHQALSKPLSRLGALKATSPSALEDFEKALATIPASSGAAYDAFIDECRAVVQAERQHRQRSFTRSVGSFVNRLRSSGTDVREVDGWRVGPLQLEVNPDRTQVRFLFDREPVTEWRSVASPEDLNDAYEHALSSLRDAELDVAAIAESLVDAYIHLSRRESRVRIRDAYPELRVGLLRQQLRGKPDRTIKEFAFPYWAFLYNLDRYRAAASSIPADQRLAFTTGSQAESAKFGVTLNGLRTSDDYRTYCFLERMPGR